MDELVSQFVGITDSTTDKARQYLNISDNNLEQAIELFFNTGGVDLLESTDNNTPQVSDPEAAPRIRPDVIEIESDGDDDTAGHKTPKATTQSTLQSDEAMARRLQEEMYGDAGGHNDGGTSMDTDAEGYRAPIARTRETLVGPDSYDLDDPSDLRAAMQEQMLRRQQGRMRHGPPGVFNQQDDPSIWNDSGSAGPPNLHEHLARATGGASRTSNTHTLLAQLYRPPFEIISPLSWEDARTEGKENSKWLLINIQDPSIFDCQILNRDIWKHEGIRDTVNESFVFLQYNKDDLRGVQYIQYYFPAHDSGDAYPHIAIVDPRTGEQVKVWSGPPAPKASEFLMQLHEFLDRYSLSATARNPVAKRKPEKKRGVDSMSEQEQLEIAMQASLANQIGSNNSNNDLLTPNNDDDPDALTRSIGDLIDLSNPSTSIPTPKKDDQQRQQQSLLSSTSSSNGTPQPSVFDLISSTTPYTEPLPTAPNTTRIQFRHPSGRRIVHRFLLSDPIRRIYEMLKADALKESDSKPFELVYMGRNLIGELDLSIQDAGLKNGTVMVEFHVDELS